MIPYRIKGKKKVEVLLITSVKRKRWIIPKGYVEFNLSPFESAKKEAFEEAGRMVYQKAFSKGLAWIPAGNILRLAPPLIMTEELAGKALDIIDESITETERHFGY